MNLLRTGEKKLYIYIYILPLFSMPVHFIHVCIPNATVLWCFCVYFSISINLSLNLLLNFFFLNYLYMYWYHAYHTLCTEQLNKIKCSKRYKQILSAIVIFALSLWLKC
jgi:hypothetical protein